MTTTLNHFKAAAASHVRAAVGAQTLYENSTPPRALAGTIAYLSSISVECSLKSLILKASKVSDTDVLKKRHLRLYESLFQSKNGHSIDKLAIASRLSAYLGNEAPQKNDSVWVRMCSSERPYSLRYGSESLTRQEANAELILAKKLHESISNLLGRPKL